MYLSFLFPLLMFSMDVTAAQTTVGSELSHLPKHELRLQGLSEEEWEMVAGGDPVAELRKPVILTPEGFSTSGATVSYQCTLGKGPISSQINKVTRDLGYSGGAWLLDEFTLRRSTTYGADTPEGVLQAIIEHTGFDGVVKIYRNQMVGFEPQTSKGQDMKKISAAVIGVALTGCMNMPASKQTDSDLQETTKPTYSKVSPSSELMMNVTPDSLEATLQQVAETSGLRLRYDAEVHTHKVTGNLTGSPSSISKILVHGLPLRTYVTSKELVVEQSWRVSPGRTLKEQLKQWDRQSMWRVVWETRKNQNLQASAGFYGTFDIAVEQLFKSVQNDGSDLEPAFYPNNTVVVR